MQKLITNTIVLEGYAKNHENLNDIKAGSATRFNGPPKKTGRSLRPFFIILQ
jgi:hypothetical protein